jgi:hypothetical protein
MSNNKDSLEESMLIKQARRRLLGAVTILIFLLILSYFFLDERNEIKKITDVKVSFIGMPDEILDVKYQNLLSTRTNSRDKFLKNEEFDNQESKKNSFNNVFFIQVGIFSNKINAKKIAKKISSIGLETKLLPITHNGQEKIQLVTLDFNDKKKANLALLKIKKAKLPGMIKQQFN